MKRYVIIVAGGSGQRMKSSIPKQFLEINTEIILMRSIRAFFNYDSSISIILVLPENQFDYWQKLCDKYQFKINHKLITGGETRFHSVKNGLQAVDSEGFVAIHDGVRPLIDKSTIDTIYKTAVEKGNAIPYIDCNNSVRIEQNNTNQIIDRNKIKLIQTPQAFDTKIILEAYKQNWDESFTDDASVVEKLGYKINLVKGNKRNIKITTKIDLIVAKAILSEDK
ncbi:MAG: 2-C-methyl-D-erythritol 4-phosphate cytidylyltransferase [Bacteroidales bacterium]|nr:2-C-methyl-D-erythritol 4-phosphate cytidylyltransferase [Bacteroidales bacterium]